MLQRGDDAQRLGVVVEAAVLGETGVQRALAGVSERRMADVMRQRQRLGEVLVQAELAGDGTSDLGDFQRMRQPGAIMVALMEHEDLRLVLEAAKGGRMDHAVAIPPEGAAGGAFRFGDQPSTATQGVAGIRRARRRHSNRHGDLSLSN